MDPLVKEFLIFFGVWPVVIVLALVLGRRLGRWAANAMPRTRLKPAALRTADIARQRV